MPWISSLYTLFQLLTISPPSNCSVNYNRDCPPNNGCVISAITNQTSILTTCIKKKDFSITCSDALKYLVHFFGDITQPLHCSNNQEGGNLIIVKFDTESPNLHHVPPISYPL